MHKAYLLMVLSVWIHFDDVLLPAFPPLQQVPVAADDEYLSLQRDQGLKRASVRHRFWRVALQSNTSDLICLARMDTPPGSTRARPFAPSALYVIMSLQL
jgi:hypothetical protein